MTESKPTTSTDAKAVAEPPKNPAPGPQSTKPVAAASIAVKDKDEDPKNAVSDNGSSKAPTDNKNSTGDEELPELTKEEEAELEELLGDGFEPELSEEDRAKGEASAKKFVKLLSELPADAPDEHTIWGAGTTVITLGDIRNVFGKVRIK